MTRTFCFSGGEKLMEAFYPLKNLYVSVVSTSMCPAGILKAKYGN